MVRVEVSVRVRVRIRVRVRLRARFDVPSAAAGPLRAETGGAAPETGSAAPGRLAAAATGVGARYAGRPACRAVACDDGHDVRLDPENDRRASITGATPRAAVSASFAVKSIPLRLQGR